MHEIVGRLNPIKHDKTERKLSEKFLRNLKAMFPGNQIGGWLLILTTFQVVPIYMVIFVPWTSVV